jgi:hypothetical protein
MKDLIFSVLSSAAVSAVLTGALIWLSKTWIGERMKNAIKHEYDEKLETHKAQLKAQSEVSVERLKSQLQIASAERNVRFSRIFERTAVTVAATYEKLLAFHDAIADYTSIVEWQSMPSKEERRKIMVDRRRDFLAYFRPNHLYLPKETAKQIQDFSAKLHSAAIDFMFGVEQGGDLRSQDPDRDTWIKVHQFISDEVPPLLELLEDDFRRILGLMDDSQKANHVRQ